MNKSSPAGSVLSSTFCHLSQIVCFTQLAKNKSSFSTNEVVKKQWHLCQVTRDFQVVRRKGQNHRWHAKFNYPTATWRIAKKCKRQIDSNLQFKCGKPFLRSWFGEKWKDRNAHERKRHETSAMKNDTKWKRRISVRTTNEDRRVHAQARVPSLHQQLYEYFGLVAAATYKKRWRLFDLTWAVLLISEQGDALSASNTGGDDTQRWFALRHNWFFVLGRLSPNTKF